MAAEETVAVNLASFTNVVVSWPPFQLTTDLGTKPVPFTVSVNSSPPGAALVGTRGSLISGAGFVCPETVPVIVPQARQYRTATMHTALDMFLPIFLARISQRD